MMSKQDIIDLTVCDNKQDHAKADCLTGKCTNIFNLG